MVGTGVVVLVSGRHALMPARNAGDGETRPYGRSAGRVPSPAPRSTTTTTTPIPTPTPTPTPETRMAVVDRHACLAAPRLRPTARESPSWRTYVTYSTYYYYTCTTYASSRYLVPAALPGPPDVDRCCSRCIASGTVLVCSSPSNAAGRAGVRCTICSTCVPRIDDGHEYAVRSTRRRR